jgi:hypothetical protein
MCHWKEQEYQFFSRGLVTFHVKVTQELGKKNSDFTQKA